MGQSGNSIDGSRNGSGNRLDRNLRFVDDFPENGSGNRLDGNLRFVDEDQVEVQDEEA